MQRAQYPKVHGLGLRLRQARLDAEHTQASLSAETGIHDVNISNYENGKHQPSLATLVQLAQALGVSTDFLLGLDDDFPYRWNEL